MFILTSHSSRRSRFWSQSWPKRWLLGALLSLTLGAVAQTPTELDEIQFSGDISHSLPVTGGGTLLSDDDTILMFDLSLGAADGTDFLGDLDGADLDAYHNNDACSARVFSVDAMTRFNGTDMLPADVFNSAGTKVLDARAEGIPDGVNIDAVSFSPVTCDLVFSIDVYAELDGATYSPSDLIAWNSTAGFSLFLTGNLDANIDALHILDDGRLLFSVDSDTDLVDLVVQDEDVIEQIPGGPGAFYVLAFSPRVFDSSWIATDLDALYAIPAALAGDFSFTRSRVEIFEDEGPLVITVQRENGSEGSVTINWTATPGTATHPADYQPASGTVDFTDGQLSGTFPVAVFNDALVEGDESFTVQLSIGSGAGSIVSPSNMTVTIIDDETTIFKDGFED